MNEELELKQSKIPKATSIGFECQICGNSQEIDYNHFRAEYNQLPALLICDECKKALKFLVEQHRGINSKGDQFL